MMKLDLHVTLWPSFSHFPLFANDARLSGIRLNSAMISNPELEQELLTINNMKPSVPLYFDVKGRQLRIAEVHENPDHLDVTLNHPIEVQTPVLVLFKAGMDAALLDHVEENGYRLIFKGGPKYLVRTGESLHIRHDSLRVMGALFTDAELAKIDKVVKAGFSKYYLSYVECQRDVDMFLELIGKDAEVMLKIESKRGMEYVAREYKKQGNIFLVAARGDLYVELERPHEIIEALELIIQKDPEACVGSRILLSVVAEPVPSCADFLELAWLYDKGYRRMLLCDELCLKEDLLGTAVGAFEAFSVAYCERKVGRESSFASMLRNTAKILYPF